MWEISVRILFKLRNVKNIYTDPKDRDQLISMWPEVLKKCFGLSSHDLTCVAYGPIQLFFDSLPDVSYYKKLLSKFGQIKRDIEVSVK